MSKPLWPSPRTHPRNSFGQSAGRWGDGIRVVAGTALILWALIWPLGCWHGSDSQGNFTWDTTSLIAEGCWLAFLALTGALIVVIRVMQR
jgi:hypothetical protein